MSKKEMLGIVKNLFSKGDLASERSLRAQDSPLLKYVKRRPPSPQKRAAGTPQEIVKPAAKSNNDVFARFEQDLKMRRLR